MTRVCMDCKAILGEKCPKCGNSDVKKTTFKLMRYCEPCDLMFPEGAGGETHTICDLCKVQRLADMPAKAVSA